MNLFKKYAKELDDFWHTYMNPINLRLMTKSGILGDPVAILKEEFYNSKVSEFVADHIDDSDDEKAFQTHYFIIYKLRVKYRSDLEVWDHVEYWQSPQITAMKKTGDCEDFTLLWLKIMQRLKVPSYKCMAIGGYVWNNNKVEGHCYPVYFNAERAVNMDLTYYTRVLRIENRATFKIPSKNYLSFWWAFNWRSCYRKIYWMR